MSTITFYDWNRPNDHIVPNNCLFGHFYADETRAEEFSERGPNENEFSSKMVEVLQIHELPTTIAKFMFNEIQVHIMPDEYHVALNRTFNAFLHIKNVSKAIDLDEKSKTVYRNLWYQLTSLAESTNFIVMLGESEDARLNPLLPNLEPCIL